MYTVYVMNSFEQKNSPFSVTKEKFYVVISGEKHGAKHIIIRACIESTSYAALNKKTFWAGLFKA